MKTHILLATSLVLVLTLLGAGLVQTRASQPLSIPQASQPDSLVFTLKVPAPQTNPDGKNNAPPGLEGFEVSGAPGDPLLPVKAYNIALPPDVIPESVKAQVIQAQTVELDGDYTLAPAPPGMTWEDDRQVVLWGKNAASIVDGKNTLVYQNNANFPQSQLSSVRFDRMRKWRLVSLLLTPLQYNPVTGKLRLATEVQVQVTFERAASIDQQKLQIELSDTVQDDQAAQLLYNYDQARAWYPVMSRPEGLSSPANYVIITTNGIVTASKSLDSFIAHKQAQSYLVRVVTVEQISGTQSPSLRAQKIRQWLIDNYQALAIQYVLLIGDPTPYDPDNPTAAVGDVPMRKCWPAHRFLKDGNPTGQNIPTDYVYSNLTGNWDLNKLGQADEYCGELTDDNGSGGMSFHPDVYVGRIPVYQNVPGWVATLDSILDKTILYEDSGDDPDRRKQALLPMSFIDKGTDGAYLAEAMKAGYLISSNYNVYTLYQHYWWGGGGAGSTSYSVFPSNQSLWPGAVPDRWKDHDYGIVAWSAHGVQHRTDIGYDKHWVGPLISASDASLLDDSHPAIVFSDSCQNGWPENPGNLGYSLLKQGAVATISSTRNSIGLFGKFVPSRANADNASMAYYIMERVVKNETVGRALYDEKYQMSLASDWSMDTNKVGNWIDFNLYGDPSLSINDGEPWVPPAPNWLLAKSNPTTGIDLTWMDNSDNELGFVIERTTTPPSGWTVAGSVGINETSWSDSGLSCGARYYYRLHAVNWHGNSSNSNQADAWSLAADEYENDDTYTVARPITPYIDSSNGAGQTHSFHTNGDVDWVKFNATWLTVYAIDTSDLGADNDTVLELYDSTGSGLLATNDDCFDGVKRSCIYGWPATSTGVFYIKVSQKDSEGGCAGYKYNLVVRESSYASWPVQPTNLTATPVSHCQVDLAWTDNAFGEDGYEIERFGGPVHGGSGMVMNIWKQIATVATQVEQYSDTGLECNKVYSYRVRAYKSGQKSFFSNEANGLTLTADSFEADNSWAAAKTITVNGASQAHNFHASDDEDWVKFSAGAGQVYTITTSSLGVANDTLLELYDKNGTKRLEWNDDCAGLESCIKKWVAPSSGTYYVQVYSFAGKGGCPGYQYTLTVTGTSNTTSLLGPSGLYFSDWTVSTLELRWPDAVAATTEHAFQVERWQPITGTRGLWRQVGIAGPGSISRSGPEGAGSANPGAIPGALPQDGYSALRDSWLTCNTTYNYRIRAFDALGDSAYSEVISKTTPLWDGFEPDDAYSQAHSLPVNTLDNFRQNHNLGPGMDIDWFTFYATAGEVYTITTSQFTHSDNLTPTLALYRDPLDVLLAATQQCGDNEHVLCINGWTASASDFYYLRVSGQGGCPGHDYFLNVTDSHLSDSWPAPPTVFTGTLTLPDQIDLTWTDTTPTDHLGFRLQRLVGLGWMQIANLGYTVTSYSDDGLACGQPYQYRLFAYNDSGDSAYTTPVEISTPACVYPIPGYPLFLPTVRR